MEMWRDFWEKIYRVKIRQKWDVGKWYALLCQREFPKMSGWAKTYKTSIMTYKKSSDIGGKWRKVSGSLLKNGLDRLKNRKVAFWPTISGEK